MNPIIALGLIESPGYATARRAGHIVSSRASRLLSALVLVSTGTILLTPLISVALLSFGPGQRLAGMIRQPVLINAAGRASGAPLCDGLIWHGRLAAVNWTWRWHAPGFICAALRLDSLPAQGPSLAAQPHSADVTLSPRDLWRAVPESDVLSARAER